MKSWVREFAERCEADEGTEPSVYIWERWFTGIVRECARRARAGTSQYGPWNEFQHGRVAAAEAIEALLEPGDEGEGG